MLRRRGNLIQNFASFSNPLHTSARGPQLGQGWGADLFTNRV